MSGFISGKNDSAAVDELLSQANDAYVLEQVAAINCAGFTKDSALPSNLETRFRRLKSLPVTRTEPVSSSSKKLLAHSKSMESYNIGKSRLGNMSSASANFSIRTGKSCPLDSAVEETNIISEIKRNPSVDSRGKLGDFSDSGRSSSTGSSTSSRSSQECNVFAPTTQTMKVLAPKEVSRISSSSSTSTDLASPSSYDEDQKERMKRKSRSKSKFLTSWFDKLSLAKAMGCLPIKSSSSSNSKKTKEIIKEDFETSKKRAEEESKQRNIMVSKVLKMSRRVESKYLRK